MPIGTTIRQLRQERGLTLNQLAALIESDVGNLSRLERNKQGYSEATLSKIATALGVPLARLFIEDEAHPAMGVGEGGVDYQVKTAVSNLVGLTAVPIADDDDSRFVQVKLVKLRLTAGISGFQPDPEYDDGGFVSVSKAWLAQNRYSRDKIVAIKIRGESMESTLYEGDTVLINLADTTPQDGAVFAINYEGEAVVKRMSRDGGDWWLMSDNPDQRKYHRKLCRGASCLVVGRVVRKESNHI